MKKGIHPNYGPLEVFLTTGSSFITMSSIGGKGKSIRLDNDIHTHPAWTKDLSTASRTSGASSNFNRRYGAFYSNEPKSSNASIES